MILMIRDRLALLKPISSEVQIELNKNDCLGGLDLMIMD